MTVSENALRVERQLRARIRDDAARSDSDTMTAALAAIRDAGAALADLGERDWTLFCSQDVADRALEKPLRGIRVVRVDDLPATHWRLHSDQVGTIISCQPTPVR